ACGAFFAWCDDRGLSLATIRPFDVSTYIESRQQTHSAPDVKQQLAAIRMLFDWLIDAIPTDTVRDLRDRALIATLTYSFARITAALKMKVEDLVPKGAGWQL